MPEIHSLLQARVKGNEQKKMAALTKRSMAGQMTTFAGVFSVAEITPEERQNLESLLQKFLIHKEALTDDLFALQAITAEVKAINNQAALLHGERIKKAQEILKRYKEGAFTAWLKTTYGNRQTPYNFLQYYEFYSALSKPQQELIAALPRQAVYSLATRKASLEDKLRLAEEVKGKSKQEILADVRSHFHLPSKDRRKSDRGARIQTLLSMTLTLLHAGPLPPLERRKAKKLTSQIIKLLKGDAHADRTDSQ